MGNFLKDVGKLLEKKGRGSDHCKAAQVYLSIVQADEFLRAPAFAKTQRVKAKISRASFHVVLHTQKAAIILLALLGILR